MKLKKPKLASLFFGFKNQDKDSPAVLVDTTTDQQTNLVDSASAIIEDNSLQQAQQQEIASGNVEAGEKQTGASDDQTRPDNDEEIVALSLSSTDDMASSISDAEKLKHHLGESHEVEEEYQESSMEHDDLVVNFTRLQLTQCERKLKEFLQSCPEAYGAIISTVDGHEIAYSLTRDIPPHKIATMNSSLLALGETIARESQQRVCQFVILENSDGRVVSLHINNLLMLTCISTNGINLGLLLSMGRSTASALKIILEDK